MEVSYRTYSVLAKRNGIPVGAKRFPAAIPFPQAFNAWDMLL